MKSRSLHVAIDMRCAHIMGRLCPLADEHMVLGASRAIASAAYVEGSDGRGSVADPARPPPTAPEPANLIIFGGRPFNSSAVQPFRRLPKPSWHGCRPNQINACIATLQLVRARQPLARRLVREVGRPRGVAARSQPRVAEQRRADHRRGGARTCNQLLGVVDGADAAVDEHRHLGQRGGQRGDASRTAGHLQHPLRDVDLVPAVG